MSSTFNLTPKRLETLRWLATRPEPVFVCGIAEHCVPRPPSSDDRPRPYWPQQATRTGAGYARPLAEAGLVLVHWETYGWGRVSLSEEGRRVLAAYDREDGTLEAELTRGRAAAKRRGLPWTPRS